MARAIWTGAISFGLVMVPVGLFSATEDRSVRFNQFQRGTSDRIRYQRVNERTGDKVDYEDIVSGQEVERGNYVIIEPEELDSIAPGKSRTIDISGFVDLSEIDVVYFAKTYYLAPQKDNERTYALLLQALQQTGKAGMATFVMRGKEHLAALRARDDVLVLQTMFFADEVRDPATVVESPGLRTQLEKGFDHREIAMAKTLIDSLAVDFEPDAYRDTYRERVAELVEAKRRGKETVTESEPAEATNVVDLMDALRRSVEQSRGGKPSNSTPSSSTSAPDGAAEEKAATGAKRQRAASGGGSGRSRRGSDSDELATMTKAELSKTASAMAIAGRSAMSRDELEAAIRAAGGKPRAKRAS